MANAKVADALSRIAQVEQRRRTVVLNLQDDRPTREELIREMEEENAQSGEDVVAKLERRLNEIIEREEAARKLIAQPLPTRLRATDEPATESTNDASESVDVDDETGDGS